MTISPDQYESRRPWRLTASTRLLLVCAGTSVDADQEKAIRTLARDAIDWDWLVGAAERHGLAPLVYRSLAVVRAEAVPAEVMERLERRYRANAIRGSWLSAELVAVLRLFEAAGVDAIPFKGPTLAETGYGDIGLREFADLDILVRPKDVARAGRVLAERGYRAAVELDSLNLDLALRCNQEMPFSSVNGVTVDLHWCATPPRMPVLLEFDFLWPRLTTVELCGHSVRSLRNEDLLLSMLFPGFRHLWSSVGWVCDISHVIQRSGDIRWQEVAEQASTRGYARMLRLGASLAAALFGASVPSGLLGERHAADEVVQRAFGKQRNDGAVVAARRRQVQLLGTIRDKARYVWGSLFHPALDDWLAIRLPRWLFFLYYPLRPPRVMVKCALGALRRS